MARSTIDYGIDLGTTNSSIAVLQSTEVRIFENNEGQRCTPSAVWIDAKNRLYVGRRAKNQLEIDPDNAHSEFKLQMGGQSACLFKHSGRTLTPEELSAEVLKSLRADVRQRTGEDIEAAVITVPASFELPQCEATRNAARLAGLRQSPLLQEPVAAALAHGFQEEIEKTFWLVYDIGGGTFDAAVVHLEDGAIQVVNHGGDNHLGGKLLDWEIVNQLLVPVLTANHPLPGFERGAAQWRGAFAKLKHHAEEAKIQLSRDEEAPVSIDALCKDAEGAWIQFEHEITRGDVQRLMEPFIERTANICKRVLADARLGPEDISKVLLVGGPTLSPLLRESLADLLEIPLDFSIDPLTVVSRGAAIFAGSQHLSAAKPAAFEPGTVSLELDYKPIDADPEPLIAGKAVPPDGESMAGWTVEMVETESQWRSGAVPLNGNGTFLTTLRAERGRTNLYKIELRDEEGRTLPVQPGELHYTMGASISSQPLIHSLGVALANNEVRVFLEKGQDLPARRREVFQTTCEIQKGQSGAFLRVPVIEGEDRKRADRNRLIGDLVVSGGGVRRTVPEGSEIEITLVVDESRQVHTLAYIPILDEEYEEVLKLEKPILTAGQMREDFEAESERLASLRDKLRGIHHPAAGGLLGRIEREQIMHDIESALAAADGDPDAADKCQSRLIDLKRLLDDAERMLEWPGLVHDVMERVAETRELLNDGKREDLMAVFSVLERETEAVLETRDADAARAQIGKIEDLQAQILASQPSFWLDYYYHLMERRGEMTDPDTAGEFFEQGRDAIARKDYQTLELVVRRLNRLMPDPSDPSPAPAASAALHSTIMPFTS